MRKAFRDITLVIAGVIFLFGGLGLFLNMRVFNGLGLVYVLMMGIGGLLLALLFKTK